MRNTIRLMALAAVTPLAAVGIGVGLAVLLYPLEATPHEAHTASGAAVVYPGSCCNSAATSPTGDCAPIEDQYVTEGPDGYEINLPVGAHPKLLAKGYKAVIPYKDKGIKQPISNDYHICLATDGVHRFCFFPKPGSV